MSLLQKGISYLTEMFLSAFMGRNVKELRTRMGIQATQRSPKHTYLRGFLSAPMRRKHALEVTESEEAAFRARTRRGPGMGDPVCVWRKVWPDNGRKSKRYAQA